MITYVKDKGFEEFYKSANDFRYGRSYVIADNDFKKLGIEHLRQIHHVADSGDSDYRYRYNGFILAKQILIDTYKTISSSITTKIDDPQDQQERLSQAKSLLAEIIDKYQKRLAEQEEDEKPKEKTPSEKLMQAIEEDDVLAFNAVFEQHFAIDDIVNCQPIIYQAVAHGSLQVCKELINQNTQLVFDDPESTLIPALGHRALSQDSKEEARIELLNLLIEQGLDINDCDKAGYTILHLAALYNMDKMVEVLLSKYKMNVDCRDQLGRTPLQLLITQDRESAALSTVEILLKHGADINAYDSTGSRPYTSAKSLPEHKALMDKYGTPTKTLSESEKSLQKLMRHAASLGFSSDNRYDYFSNDSDEESESDDDERPWQKLRQCNVVIGFSAGNRDNDSPNDSDEESESDDDKRFFQKARKCDAVIGFSLDNRNNYPSDDSDKESESDDDNLFHMNPIE